MSPVRALAPLLVLLAACSSEPPAPPPKAAEPVSTCALSLDALAGKTFVHVAKNEQTKEWEEDILARASFYEEGGVLKAKYNTRSLADMYTYTCQKDADGKKVTCKEDGPDAGDYCRSVIANGKECTVEEIQKLTGLSAEDAQKGIKEVQAEVKKLPKKELEDMKKVFNSPNNQLRGILHLKIKEKDCLLVLSDNYETISFGQIREMQNVVGSAYFRIYDKQPLVFEHCKDDKGLVALSKPGATAKPGESKRDWKVGEEVPYRYVGTDAQRPKSGCTYSMDTWVQYEPLAQGTAVAPDSGGRLDWSFTHKFAAPGRNIVHMYRYEQCGSDPKKLMTVSCQGTLIE